MLLQCLIQWEVIGLAFNVFEMFGVIDADNQKANDAIDETTGKAKKSTTVFNKLGSGLKVLGTGMAVAAGAAGVAVVGLSKKILSAYADYEQLVGGVDTLFDKASKKVQQYADEAFRTAGLSANEYMETVTSFSASLLQSLGGDTQKAADVANQAVIDMSDNANKMGTNIAMIQNAYQGFAKQNYTMLDNLKLGYGGTKEEMQRLLADAEKLSGIKYDLSNFADVTEAIHVIQTEMGITGTTAKEATETISGSIAGMKSAWENLVIGMGNSNADIGKLLDNLIEQFGYVVKNVTPILDNVIQALPKAFDGLSKALEEILPTLLETIADLFSKVLEKLMSLLPDLIPVAVDALLTITQAIIDNLPLLIDAAVVLITALASGLTEALPTLIPATIQAIITIAKGLIDNLPLLADAALELMFGLADELRKAAKNVLTDIFPELSLDIDVDTFFDKFSKVIDLLEKGAPIISAAAGAILTFKTYMMGLSIASSISTAIGSLKTAFIILSTTLSNLGLGGTISMLMGFMGPVGWVITLIGALAGAFIYLFNTNETFRDGVINAWTNIVGFLQPLITGLINYIQSVFGLFVTWWQENQNTILFIFKTIWTTIQIVFDTIWGIIQMIVLTGLTMIQTFFNMWGSALLAVVKVIWSLIKAVFTDTINTILNIVTSVFTQIKIVIETIMGVIQGIIKVVTGVIKGDWSRVWEGIQQIFVSVLDGILKTLSNVMGTIAEIVSDKIDVIKGFFSDLGDIDLFKIGKDIIDGFVGGLQSGIKRVGKVISNIGSGIKDKLVDLFDIHSPSKWARNHVGKWIPLGVAKGIEDESDSIQNALDNAANQLTFDTNRLGANVDLSRINPNVSNSYAITDDLADKKDNKESGDTFNITIQALGDLSEIQLMNMAKKLVKFIKELKDREDAPKGGVLGGI